MFERVQQVRRVRTVQQVQRVRRAQRCRCDGRWGPANIEQDLRGHIVVPGFVDVHVHGVEGIDTLDGGNAIAALAGRLTKYGVTAFCPTTVACAPDALRQVLQSVAALRNSDALAARVLPAHLESNFINPEYRGAQPMGACGVRARVGRV